MKPPTRKPWFELSVRLPWRRSRQVGVTLPLPLATLTVYLLGRGDTLAPDLRVHEHAHVVQTEGRVWCIAIARYVWRWIAAGCSYRSHPDEVEAREVQDRELPDWARRPEIT
jgi:hypothetical protein